MQAINDRRPANDGGTHIDAPIHFSEDGLAVNEVPLSDLVGPAVVIDVSEEAADNPVFLTRANASSDS